MTVTERDVQLMMLLLDCGFLTTGQIRRELFPTDGDGSQARDRLRKLEAECFAMRRRAEVANPLSSTTMPTWIITEKGICQLALRLDDISLLKRKPPCVRSWQNYAHYVAVADLILHLRRAIAAQKRVDLLATYFEHTVVNDADDLPPHKRYKLFTSIAEQPRKLVCAPDAAWEFRIGDYRRAYYIELERGTDSPVRVAAKKTPGYHGLFESKKWKSHFPQANDFRVLCVAPKPSWRDALRKAVKDKKGAELWMFAAVEELTADFLHGLAVYQCEGGPRPLVPPEAPPPHG